jgi:hypothetical protein
MNDSTSAMVGIEGCAPTRVTDTAATAAAKNALACGGFPSISPTAKAPLKASPAAVVSIAFTAKVCAPVQN